MKHLSSALVALGLIGLLYGGIRYTRESKLFDVEPFRTATTAQPKLPISPIVGGIALIAGVVLLVGPRRRLI